MSDKTTAPFTPDQVASLNAYQVSGVMHPFTCGNGGHAHGVLKAQEDGWHCEKCDYTQDWAHAWMADWSWRKRYADGMLELLPPILCRRFPDCEGTMQARRVANPDEQTAIVVRLTCQKCGCIEDLVGMVKTEVTDGPRDNAG